jgi:class 3 adenylate cyclase
MNRNYLNNTLKWKTSLNHYACAVRPVAAIMVTKISGFTALAEKDQAAGDQLLTQSYNLQDYYAKQFGSVRMVKMGDIVLMAFSSAEQAVNCAFKVERGARKMFNHKLRIGVHMGEVRFVEGDVFGGPLNIAQDILNTAKPGEVLISESIARSINNKKWQVEAHGISGPMAIPTYTVKHQISLQGFSAWNYQGSDSSSHLVSGGERTLNYGA